MTKPDAASGDVPAYWDDRYRDGGLLWGEQPSELAAVAIGRLRELGPAAARLRLLDLGCGYGRDALVLWRELGLSVTGVDGAARAIELARAALPVDARARVLYRIAALDDLGDGGALGAERFDVVYSSNVYHLLDPAGRAVFRAAVRDRVTPGGLVFVSTLSARDPEHHGRGRPVPGDPGSFIDHTYLHFCTRDELGRTFDFLDLERVEELAYLEERPSAPPHDHVSWIVVGRAPAAVHGVAASA